jgi:hypothetical protein
VNIATLDSLCEHHTESLWLAVADRLSTPPPPPGFDSLIVPEFPPLFEEFRKKRFNLLWRGSSDGFTAREFHRRCDGHANTLTLILDTDGNVFGGFTPVEWESRMYERLIFYPGLESVNLNNCWKNDNSLRSFLFTLRNPRGVPPRKFVLRKEWKQKAIFCSSPQCCTFGGDIAICTNCNTSNESCTQIGNYYQSSGTDLKHFTGAYNFRVKEIEIFEIK